MGIFDSTVHERTTRKVSTANREKFLFVLPGLKLHRYQGSKAGEVGSLAASVPSDRSSRGQAATKPANFASRLCLAPAQSIQCFFNQSPPELFLFGSRQRGITDNVDDAVAEHYAIGSDHFCNG